MSTIQLNRTQRRLMKKLAERVDRVTQADRLFFERFPNRQHRVRLASQAEIEQNAVLTGSGDMILSPGQQHYVAVKNVAPGHRMRLSVVGPINAETDLNEDEARRIYEVVNNFQSCAIEAELRKLAGVA
jgi:hypothetical protein